MSNQSLKDKALEIVRTVRESLAPQRETKRVPPPRLPIRLVSRARYRVQRDATTA